MAVERIVSPHIVGTLSAPDGATFAGAVVSTSTITTTDGVASGAARRVGGMVSNLAAAGTSLTNSTSETVLASCSIPANTIVSGTHIRYSFAARVTANNGATQLTCRVRLGGTTLTGTVLVTVPATDTSQNDMVVVEGHLVGRAAAGAAAAVLSYGTCGIGGPAAGAALVFGTAASNYATNGALLLEVTGQWGAADANAVQAEALYVEVTG